MLDTNVDTRQPSTCMTRIERRNANDARRGEKERGRERRGEVLRIRTGRKLLLPRVSLTITDFFLYRRVSCPEDSVSLDDFGIPATSPSRRCPCRLDIIQQENRFSTPLFFPPLLVATRGKSDQVISISFPRKELEFYFLSRKQERRMEYYDGILR